MDTAPVTTDNGRPDRGPLAHSCPDRSRPSRMLRHRGGGIVSVAITTCASLAIAGGANVKVLQTLLGHKTATLTLDRYGHLFPDDLGRIADAFDAAADRDCG
jgi:integrase